MISNMTKEKFVLIIEGVIAQTKRDREISKSIDKIAPQSLGSVYTTPLVDVIIQALDKDDVIAWWIWEGPEGGKKADKYAIYSGDPGDPDTERIVIKSAGDLYDYLVWIEGGEYEQSK